MALLHDFDRRQKRPPSKQEAIELVAGNPVSITYLIFYLSPKKHASILISAA